MKRFVLIFLSLALFCSNASAQWYLYRKNKQAKPAEVPAETAVPATADSAAVTADTVKVNELELFSLDIPEEINLTLVLPLVKPASQQSNSAMYDFYSGAMLAAKEWGEKGTKVCVNVIDSWNSREDEINQTISTSDITIYAADSLHSAAKCCERGKCIVAPLLPVENTDSLSIVQVATPWQYQVEKLASWIKRDLRVVDEVVILDDRWPMQKSDTLLYLMESLDRLHQKYDIAPTPPDRVAPSFGSTFFVCVSNNTKYLSKVLQTVATQRAGGGNISFYSTSRIRSLRGIEDSEIFYTANAHIVAQYALDYNDSKTLNFIQNFQQLCQNEPTRFAFHGYDVVNYFVSACSQYGRYWKMKIDELPTFCGIQSDFKFRTQDDGTMINTACSRIHYCPNLTVRVIR